MKAISRVLLACAAVTIAASQAAAGEFVVAGGPGGYRYRDAPPLAYAHGPWRYRRDWAPRYYAPQYHNDLGAAIAGGIGGVGYVATAASIFCFSVVMLAVGLAIGTKYAGLRSVPRALRHPLIGNGALALAGAFVLAGY